MGTETHGARVKARILDAGLQLWPAVSARAVGREISLTHQAVLYHMGTADDLRDAVARHAVAVGDKRVVPVLITTRHPAAARLSAEQRAEFLTGC